MCDNLIQIDNILAENTNEETQEILETAREEILAQIDGKIENILEYIADCQARAEQLRAEAARLSQKRGSLDKKVDYLKNLVYFVMKTNNLQKTEYGTYTVSVAKTPARVVIDNEELIPAVYLKTTYSIDKELLKAHMKETDGRAVVFDEEGKKVIVAHMEQGESLRIK